MNDAEGKEKAGESANETRNDTAAPVQPQVPEGAIEWKDAGRHVGETITVYGPVVSTEYASTSNGQPTFLDIGLPYPDKGRVSVTIWGESRDAFPVPPEEMYDGETVCVTGEVYLYNEVCNIEASSSSQINIL